VDASLTAWLDAHRLPWLRVGGAGPERLDNAVKAAWPAVQAWRNEQGRDDRRG
jgi:hypothetical protein